MSYLLDTNTWIHYLKNLRSRIREKLAALRPAEVVTCSIVRGELLHGAEKYGSRSRRIALVQTTLAPFVSLPFDDQDAKKYGFFPRYRPLAPKTSLAREIKCFHAAAPGIGR